MYDPSALNDNALYACMSEEKKKKASRAIMKLKRRRRRKVISMRHSGKKLGMSEWGIIRTLCRLKES